jgi:glycosyltransferase involved in cell wall biosynthesis
VVVDGENGILIPPNNCEALCEAILRLYRNPGIALQMGASGRKRAVEQFTWDHFRRRVSEAYRAAMAIRQPQLV